MEVKNQNTGNYRKYALFFLVNAVSLGQELIARLHHNNYLYFQNLVSLQ